MARTKLPKEPNFPRLEEDILRYWKAKQVFERSLKQTRGRPPYVFYEGPPTANGKPHIGHVVTRIFKDIVPRYKTMQGFHVLRKGGWDTHGLPVEIEVEKELGISGKQDIENIIPGNTFRSIATFNEYCKQSVWKYVKLWEKMVNRVGNWIDLPGAYITYENNYIESVWWAFAQYWKGGLLYRGYKVVPYCTRCGTPLSSHEVAQGYEEVTDPSVYVTFPLSGDKHTALLAWTTTPWTLPGNIALAVDPTSDYVKAKVDWGGAGESYVIVAKARAAALGLANIVETFPGQELIGRTYHPPFPWLRSMIARNDPQFMVVEADFVSMEEGTGIVHTAVMYGEEDYALGKKLKLPQHHLVDKNGRFLPEAGWLTGKYVKDADPLIVHDLRTRNLLFREEKVRHQYPFCWRCHKPLIYYALESWFIKTTAVKDALMTNNKSVNWIPEYIGRGRMGNWYETLIDWSVSRNRYWGTPLPAWVCDKDPAHIEVIGSFDELSRKIRKRLPRSFDPHRPFIDTYTWACSHRDGGTMRRVPEVTDAWHDSGSMPFAQWHYPFENKEMIGTSKGPGKGGRQFPADYISEGVDQTRGWFYSLQAVSTMLFGQSPYRNVVSFAHALDERGRKMSKHLGNVLDPWEAIAAVGADPIRWFFLTAVTIGMPYRVSVEVLRDTVRRFFLVLWNCLIFAETYASADRWRPGRGTSAPSPTGALLDRWVLAKANDLVEKVTTALDAYDFPTAGRAIQEFVVTDLSTWYIRRSRARVGQGLSGDAVAFYETMHDVLRTVATLLAPFIPFTAEFIFQRFRQPKDPLSVHLLPWPAKRRVDRKLLAEMTKARRVVEEGLRIRKEKGVKLRQPLVAATVSGIGRWPPALMHIVADELNVKSVKSEGGSTGSVSLDTRLTPALKEEGMVRELIRTIQDLRRKAGYRVHDRIVVETRHGSQATKKLIAKHRGRIEAETHTGFGTVAVPDAEGSLASVTIRLGR